MKEARFRSATGRDVEFDLYGTASSGYQFFNYALDVESSYTHRKVIFMVQNIGLSIDCTCIRCQMVIRWRY